MRTRYLLADRQLQSESEFLSKVGYVPPVNFDQILFGKSSVVISLCSYMHAKSSQGNSVN